MVENVESDYEEHEQKAKVWLSVRIVEGVCLNKFEKAVGFDEYQLDEYYYNADILINSVHLTHLRDYTNMMDYLLNLF